MSGDRPNCVLCKQIVWATRTSGPRGKSTFNSCRICRLVRLLLRSHISADANQQKTGHRQSDTEQLATKWSPMLFITQT